MLSIRLAILLFYHRLFPTLRMRIAIPIITSIVIGIGIASVFTSIFQCTPIRYSWNKSVEGSCLESNKHYMGGPVTSFLLDLIILILPFEVVWQLQLSTRKKIDLMFVLSVGGLSVVSSPANQSDFLLTYDVGSTCFSAIVRESYFVRHQSSDFSCVYNNTHVHTYEETDNTLMLGNHVELGLWTSTEESLSFVCSSVPFLRVVYRGTRDRWLSMRNKSLISKRSTDNLCHDGTTRNEAHRTTKDKAHSNESEDPWRTNNLATIQIQMPMFPLPTYSAPM